MIKHITRLFSLIALFAISNVAQAQTSCSGVEVVHFMETIINAHSGVQNSQNNLGPADGESAYFPGQISMSWELGEWLPAGTEIWVRYKNDCDSAHFIQAGFPCWQEANGNWAVMTDTYNIKSTTYVWDKIILTDSANKFAYEHRGTCDIYIDCFKWYTCETGVNTIEGHYFGDLSNFGTFDASEPRIIGEKIYLFLDANGNGVLDASEMTPIDSTETDIEGYYQLHDEYTGGTVKYIVQPATLIASGIYSTDTSHLVTFTSANNESTDNDFGVRESVTITGSVFKDVNINGIYNTGENPESGIDVYLYLDANNNGVLDASETTVVATQTTGADGTYTFTEVYIRRSN